MSETDDEVDPKKVTNERHDGSRRTIFKREIGGHFRIFSVWGTGGSSIDVELRVKGLGHLQWSTTVFFFFGFYGFFFFY